jgi:hypothetical protein
MAHITFPQPTSFSGSAVPNPLDKKPGKNDKVEIEYTEEQYLYRNYLIQRLERAKENRDRRWAEFSGKTYLQCFEENEKIAHTYLEEVKNKNEEKISTGTIESKLNTLLAHVNNLNLMPEVLAFDRDNQSLHELGKSFTDVMFVTAEHDGGDDGGDKEKKMNRQRELLKQGTVFVQENWITKYEVKKKLKKVYKGEFKDFGGYDQSLQKVFEGCSRDILYGPNVYLGDMTAFSMNDQPFVFTIEQMHYDEAKTLFGKFENWDHVRPGIPDTGTTDATTSAGARTIYDTKWRLTNIKDDHVEVIRYQDQGRDEYQIMINGVMMMPVGFPLSAVTPRGKYSVTKQVLYVINAQFAMGKSFVSSGSVYELSKAVDRMLRLFELKTRKSINTPYVNTTNRVIPARALDPGNISMGIAPNALQPIGNEGQGVTSSEYQIFKELQDEIDKSTISPTFAGQQGNAGTTATEIIEVQRQARLTLGLIIAACTLLEMKLGYLRLWNVLGNWLEPVGRYPDGSNKFRNATRLDAVEGAGSGERRIIPIDGELPDPEVIRMLSLRDEKKKGYPVRRTYLSPKLVREAEITWFIRVLPKEEESSAFHKLQFRELVGDALALMQMGAQINIEGLQDELASVYNKDRSKIFSDKAVQPALPPEDASTTAGNIKAGNNTAGAAQATQPQPKPQVTR